MIANNSVIKDKDKRSVSDRNYFFCEICEFNGYPNENRYEGLRSEYDEGFITVFTVYDYPIQRGKKISHVHKHNKLFGKFVNLDIGEEIGVKTSQ